jgi:N-acetylglucosaminyl-diphospho-decaprenol L-rhamnosyltransferase
MNERNPGYGAGLNQAIARCSAPYLLLNSDTQLQPGALRALSTYLDQHPQAALVGSRLANLDGALQASCYPFPTPLNLFLEQSGLGQLIRDVARLRVEREAHERARLAENLDAWQRALLYVSEQHTQVGCE